MNSSISNSERNSERTVDAPASWRGLLALTAGARRAHALFAAACVAILLGANVLLAAIFHRDNYQRMAVRALTPEVQVLVIGSSRVHFGVDPRAYKEKLVGLAANYLDLRTAAVLEQVHANKIPHAKRILVELDVATTRYDTVAINPYGTLDLGLPLIPPARELVRDFDGVVHRVLAPLFNWRLTPEFVADFRASQRSRSEPMDAVPGYIPTKLVVTFPELYAERKVREGTKQLGEAGERYRAGNIAALASLVTRARARGAEVVLLRFPLEPTLRAVYPPEWDAMVAADFAELAQQVSPAPRFWDLSRDAAFASAEFRDPDHLNAEGAKHLAARIDGLLR